MKHKIKTLADIAKILSTLSWKELQQPAKFLIAGGAPTYSISELHHQQTDYLINKTTPDEYGYENDLKLKYGKSFDRNCYDILLPNGQVILTTSSI